MERIQGLNLKNEELARKIEEIRALSETWPLPKSQAIELVADRTGVHWSYLEDPAVYLGKKGVLRVEKVRNGGRVLKALNPEGVAIMQEAAEFLKTTGSLRNKNGSRRYKGLIDHLKSKV